MSDELRSDNKIVGQWVGMVVEGLWAEPILVASVYNYCHHRAGLADSVAAAAHQLSAGAVIAGGDWNFSRTCDGTPRGKWLWHSGVPAPRTRTRLGQRAARGPSGTPSRDAVLAHALRFQHSPHAAAARSGLCRPRDSEAPISLRGRE